MDHRPFPILPIIAACGCYSYVPSEKPAPIGSHVEVTLTDDALDHFRNQGIHFVEYFTTGAGALDGVLLSRTADSLVVQIASVHIESYNDHTLYQHVSLANSDLKQVRQRTHNVAATMALTGIAGSIVTLALLRAFGSSSDDCPPTLMVPCS